MDTLPGNPGALAQRTEDLSASARAIQEAAEALFELSFAGSGKALDIVAERADELAGKVKAAYGRYHGTAAALTTYAVELQAAHVKFDDAQNEANAAARHLGDVEESMDKLRDLRERLERTDPNDPHLPHIDDQIRGLVPMRDRYQSQAHDASAQKLKAEHDLNKAAEHAIRGIDAALSDTNDGFWDKVGDFFANIGAFLDSIHKWIDQVLKTIITAVLLAIAAVIALVILVVLLQAMLAWIILVSPLLLGIAGLLLLSLLVPGLAPWRTQLLALLIGVAVPLIGGLLLQRILSDLLAPTPKVSELPPLSDPLPDHPTDPQKAQQDANTIAGFYSTKDYMEAEGLTDRMGGEDRTVVDIRKVVGPDGVERWVVNLPSTQDWLVTHGDTGATNDLDSNLALMLTPDQQTQYERAVLQAMTDAGIDKNDPVMLVGFSQGGIMAGHLAADRSSEFNFAAVLAYGAPIDAMNIPDSTRVLSIQHTGDIVPTLDLTNPKPNTANHVTIQVDANDGTIGVTSHNNDKYMDTAAYSAELAPYQNYFNDFSGTVVEEHQYTWHE
ncbi:MAG: hypothetical protein ABI632_08200 [Pseudolysinimonas sp.]